LLGMEKPRGGLMGRIHEGLRNSGHRWLWDYRSLEGELSRAGFSAIRRAEYGDSTDSMFQDVEDAARWRGALGVDCRKSGR